MSKPTPYYVKILADHVNHEHLLVDKNDLKVLQEVLDKVMRDAKDALGVRVEIDK
jgi:hypothetical protein